MLIKSPLFLALGLAAAPLALHAAPASTQEQEYEQVRKIALRDPKVRAAYADADRKLEAKILQIDPALEPYLRQRAAGTTAPQTPTKSTPTPAPTPKPKAAPTPAPKPAATPTPKLVAAKPKPARTHVVMKGDTLNSIAAKYGVTAATLKSANKITDERKLAIGQVLTIPTTPTH
jgi:LysM repeat protein